METTILNLPQDLLAHQITYLPFSDVISLCQSNPRLHYFCMASTPRQKLLWKILIQDTFSKVYDYQNKLKKLSDKFGTKDIDMDGYCYNYLVYTSFVRTLDKATQMMIYYKQGDMESFSGTLGDRYMAMFLLNNPAQMDKLFGQMEKGKNYEFHEG